MKGKIVFEEHIAIEETLGRAKAFAGDSGHWEDFSKSILDIGEQRIELMDKNGIDFSILSNNSPGIQGLVDKEEAILISKKANDKMAEAVAKYPNRYGAFAALPMQDPDSASMELTRCIKDLGFYGALVNSFTQKNIEKSAIYYDIPEYRSFWATVSELNVPFYLHPRMQLESYAPIYDGHPWLKSAPWGFAVDTSIHALRMCGSGMFEDFPNLKIILGHLGEHIPYDLWRIDARMKFSPRGYRGNRPLGEYFLNNFLVTTSGNFNDPAFKCCLDVLGVDKIFFSTDYPFENMEDACYWFDNTQVIDENERLKIGRTNAIDLFNLNFLNE